MRSEVNSRLRRPGRSRDCATASVAEVTASEIHRLRADQLEEIAELLSDLATAQKGWMNLLPVIPEEIVVPDTPGVLAVFSKRGPVVPMATWTAPTPAKSGRLTPSEIGVMHGQAGKVKELLLTEQILPADWRVLQDNARRGLVLQPGDHATLVQVAEFLVGVTRRLCRVSISDQVDCAVYHPK